MNINLTPEQKKIVKDELKSGHFRAVEEVIDRGPAGSAREGAAFNS